MNSVMGDPDHFRKPALDPIRIKEKSLELWMLTKNRGGSAWKSGRSVGQWLQAHITLIRSRIRIRIKVKSRIGIGIRIKVKSKIRISQVKNRIRIRINVMRICNKLQRENFALRIRRKAALTTVE
jgi:hypothetical protein